MENSVVMQKCDINRCIDTFPGWTSENLSFLKPDVQNEIESVEDFMGWKWPEL